MLIKKQYYVDDKKHDKKVKRKAKKEKRSESSIIRELVDNLNNHD